MSKTNIKKFSPFKGFFVSLSVLAILGSLLAGVSYFNQDLENNSNLAQAALNCPAGYTLVSGSCQYSATAGAPTYSCPNGGALNGSNCSYNAVQGSGSYNCPSGGALNGQQCSYNATAAPVAGTCPNGGVINSGECRYTSNCYTTNVFGQCTYRNICDVSATFAWSAVGKFGTGVGTNNPEVLGFCASAQNPANASYDCPFGGTISDATCIYTSPCYTTNVFGQCTYRFICQVGWSAVGNFGTGVGTNNPEVLGTCQRSATNTPSNLLIQTCPSGGSAVGTVCYYNANLVAGVYTCPLGGTVSGTSCAYTATATPAGYSCPSGGTLNGTVCISSSTSYTPDAGQITGITCDNTSPVVGSNLICTVVGTGAPSGVSYGGSVTLSIDNGGATSTCTFTGSATTTCTPVNVGTTVGAKTVTTSSGGSLAINVIKVNFGKLDWIFNPDQGGTSPIFRGGDSTSITVNNFRTSTDLTPTSNTRYTCTLEYRNFNDRSGTELIWTALDNSLTTPKVYTTGSGANTGCTINFTKQQRANILNHSLRLTITDTSVTNPSASNPNTYLFYNEYIYRFQGAGVAVGA